MGRCRREHLKSNCWHAKSLFGELDGELTENGVLQNDFIGAIFHAYGRLSDAERWREAWQLADLLHHVSTFVVKSETVSQQAGLLEIDSLIQMGEYQMAFEIIQDTLQKGSTLINCVRSKVMGSMPTDEERTRRGLLLCRENEDIISKMLSLDATTVPQHNSLSMQFLGLLIAKLQLGIASKIHFPPVRGKTVQMNTKNLWSSRPGVGRLPV
ncbi:unnamed protein product [Schistocephalus solidus]|uniref:Uncharacterized protein n=1 Tax=Schistocephalus solidus TaxID=70667 RepID=A0A183TPW6_SCHSO|nr:unnamed protein product [Schistocephalus solidus]